MEVSITFSIPDVLENQIDASGLYGIHGDNGIRTSYGFDLEMPALSLYRQVRSQDLHLLAVKIQTTLNTWEKKYLRHLQVEHKTKPTKSAEELNEEIVDELRETEGILRRALTVDDTIDWDFLKCKDKFAINPDTLVRDSFGRKIMRFDESGRPTTYRKRRDPEPPDKVALEASKSFWVRTFRKGKIDKEHAAAMLDWQGKRRKIALANDQQRKIFENAVQEFKSKKTLFELKLADRNAAVDAAKARYENRKDDAIEEYCELVMTASKYPVFFPKTWTLGYNAALKTLVVDYDLPAPSDLPKVQSYSYVASTDEITEKPLNVAARRRSFNSTAYQICLRTIHELFEADTIDALKTIVFNGLVTHMDATGKSDTTTILSVSANKDSFLKMNLSGVDPKSTFENLEGVAADDPMELSPVSPVAAVEASDKRFLEGGGVMKLTTGSVNVAAFVSDSGQTRILPFASPSGADAGS